MNRSVAKDQITVKGYGEGFPLERCECDECEDQSHELNRRLVVKRMERRETASQERIETLPGKENGTQDTIYIQVGVDRNGRVISAENVKSKSTSTDEKLIEKAISSAEKHIFEKGKKDIEYGTVKIVFKKERQDRP